MARLPRLGVAGQTHLVIQRAHNGSTVFAGGADRRAWLDALRDAASTEAVQVHAWALLDSEVQLLATPAEPAALSRLMQALGRRFVAAHNRRHGRSGTLWDGRFRCGVVEPGALRLQALCLVDGASPQTGMTSAAHRLGGPRDGLLVDPPEYWQLGNTPFERESAWRARLDAGLDRATAVALRDAALGGWALGSAAFKAGLAAMASRPAAPRPRGRPRRAAAAAVR